MIELSPGDRLVLFTDGITEVSGPDGQEFGEDTLAALAKDNRFSSASALVGTLLGTVTDFCANRFQDDATLVVIAAS